jgi:nucleoside-diphosphate-sugar epimerase
MRLLLTGAQGFVGRYVSAAALRQHPEAEILGLGRSGPLPGTFSHTLCVGGAMRAPLPAELATSLSDPRFRYKECSIVDAAKLTHIIREFQPDRILHLASGLRGDADAALIVTNVQGTATLLSAIVAAQLSTPPHVVLGSSGGVYGRFSADSLPLTETTACDPADVYSATKLAAEHIGRVLGRTHDIPVSVARIFNIVGPGQDERHVVGRFARELHERARLGGEIGVGQLNTTRDFIDVRDVADALLLLCTRAAPDSVYNIASGTETPIRTVLDLLLRCSGSTCVCYSSPAHTRASDVPRHCGDITALRRLGFHPRVSLAQSLADVFQYYDTLPAFQSGKLPIPVTPVVKRTID